MAAFVRWHLAPSIRPTRFHGRKHDCSPHGSRSGCSTCFDFVVEHLLIYLTLISLIRTQAVKRDPTNAAYRNNLAAALTKIGDFNAAKAACEKVRLANRSLPSVGAAVDVFHAFFLPFGDERR